MDASWPVAGKIDQPLLKSADYLAARAHDFRVRIKAMMNPKGKKVNTVNYTVISPIKVLINPYWRPLKEGHATLTCDKGEHCKLSTWFPRFSPTRHSPGMGRWEPWERSWWTIFQEVFWFINVGKKVQLSVELKIQWYCLCSVLWSAFWTWILWSDF